MSCNTHKKIVKRIQVVNNVKMKLATKDIEKHAETGSQMDV